jgi:hypothetical protein
MSVTSALVAAAMQLVAGLEGTSGVPIAMLDRIEEPAMFWARAAAKLCDKTGDEFCEEQVRFMTANTEPLGMSRIIVYQDKAGRQKKVCAVLPPVENPDPTMVAEAFGGAIPQASQVPSYDETAAWLTMYHATHCLDTTGTADEEDRAAAFATLALTLLRGDPVFTPGNTRAAGRQLAVLSGKEAAYWAAGVGERSLLDVWKGEAAAVLRRTMNCEVTVTKNASIDIEGIRRDQSLREGENCEPPVQRTTAPTPSNPRGTVVTSGTPRGTVTDANLWIWMYGQGGVGVPPQAWTWGKLFGSAQEASAYILAASTEIARQR